MNADKVLAAETVIALAAVSTGDLLAQGSARSLPSPRRIVGTLIFYSLLSLFAAFSAGAARFASAVGGVVVLATLVLGTGGKSITSLIGNASNLVSQTPEGQKPTAPAATATPQPSSSVISKALGALKGLLEIGVPGFP